MHKANFKILQISKLWLFRSQYNFSQYFDPTFSYDKKQNTENIKQLLTKMQSARTNWKVLDQSKRNEIIANYLKLLEKQTNKTKFADIISRTVGYSPKTALQQVNFGLQVMKNQLSAKYQLHVSLNTGNESPNNDKGFYQLKPYGIVLSIFNHNMAFLSSVKYLVLSLVSGNNILLHPQHICSPLASQIVQLWKESSSLQHKDMINVIKHHSNGKYPQEIQELLNNIDVGFMSFTGNTEEGQSMYKTMASTSQCFAESQFLLEGNDACYVMDDLYQNEQKLKKVADLIFEASFSYGGKLPHSVKRLFGSKKMIQKLTSLLILQAQKIKSQIKESNGRNLTIIAPLLEKQSNQFDSLLKKIKQNTQEYTVVTGGNILEYSKDEQKANKNFKFWQPTIIKRNSNVGQFVLNTKSNLSPILALQQVDNINEAIEYINQSSSGLTTTIFTQDSQTVNGFQNIARRLEVGTVNLNTWKLSPETPISCRKRSGKGFSSSHLALENITRTKTVTF